MRLKGIYLDMDGVIVNLVDEVLKLHGRSERLHTSTCPKGLHWLEEFLQKPTGEVWSPVNAIGADFWANLPVYPWWESLLDLCRANAECVLLLSKPLNPSSSFGKHQWIERHFGRGYADYSLTPPKFHMAGPGRLLIDDCEENVRQWRNAGGAALLFPQPWNSGRGDSSTVLNEWGRIIS